MFNITKHGWNFIHKDSSFSIDRRNDTINSYILLIVRSPFFMSLNNESIKTYNKNCIILLSPNTAHHYGPLDNLAFVNDWVHFTTDETIPLKENTVFENFNDHDIAHLSHIINDIVTERREDNLHSEEICSNQMRYVILKIDQLISIKERMYSDNPHYSEMLYIRNKFLGSFQNDISINDFAEEVHLSSSFFRHLYKEFFNISPQSDLINARIQYAKYLLKTTDDPINKIAEDCGYTNHEHFMRQFKNKVGMTPSEYR